MYDEPRWICLADLNNNGWLDLFVPDVASDRSIVLWGGPEGFSMERSQLLSVHHAACARAADLNANGYLDLIVGGHTPALDGPLDSFAYIYWNGPDGLREDRRTLLPANAINSMAVADFNNDGMLDIYIGSYHDARERDIDSYIYWNREGRGFSANDRTRLFTHSASGSLAADFNEKRLDRPGHRQPPSRVRAQGVFRRMVERPRRLRREERYTSANRGTSRDLFG